MKKKRIGILFGGKSAEHEISLLSAKNIIEALDPERYELLLIGIDKQGKWHLNNASEYLLNAQNPKLIKLNHSKRELSFVPGRTQGQLIETDKSEVLENLDAVFPVLHGPWGEDGTIQGLLRLANIPFVGCSILSSAVCMDKDFSKRLFEQAGIPICKHVVLKSTDKDKMGFEQLVEKLGLPMFLKPANMGSSVGISKVNSKESFEKGLEEAFLYDHKVVIEESIVGRELEVAVLGNNEVSASVVGEILPQKDFYSYTAKYVDSDGALLKIPADLDKVTADKIRDLAIKSFKTMECQGLARCDFFLTKEGDLFLNEINTLPGFTKISMYPKLWEAAGLPYTQLINKLLELAIERHEHDGQLKTIVDS